MNTQSSSLKLYEALMLLALCEEKGTINGSYISYSTAAAILAELLLLERIEISTDKTNHVLLKSNQPTEDSLLDDILRLIENDKKRRNMQSWVEKIANQNGLNDRVAKVLVDNKIVKLEEKKILWLFTKKVYPELNPIPETLLRNELRALVTQEKMEVSTRLVVLLSLAKSANLLPQFLNKNELIEYKSQIDALTSGESIGLAAKGAIEAVETAMMLATLLPAISAATTVTIISS